MDLGKVEGFSHWAREERLRTVNKKECTYLLCSINNLFVGKREKQKAKESMSFIRFTPSLPLPSTLEFTPSHSHQPLSHLWPVPSPRKFSAHRLSYRGLTGTVLG